MSPLIESRSVNSSDQKIDWPSNQPEEISEETRKEILSILENIKESPVNEALRIFNDEGYSQLQSTIKQWIKHARILSGVTLQTKMFPTEKGESLKLKTTQKTVRIRIRPLNE